jgi:hypothetical protein
MLPTRPIRRQPKQYAKRFRTLTWNTPNPHVVRNCNQRQWFRPVADRPEKNFEAVLIVPARRIWGLDLSLQYLPRHSVMSGAAQMDKPN